MTGVKVLKRGMIQVGATNCTARMAAVAAIQHQSHASGPAQPKKTRTTARSGPPRSTVRTSPLARSAANVAGVVRLKSKRASMTNVE